MVDTPVESKIYVYYIGAILLCIDLSPTEVFWLSFYYYYNYTYILYFFVDVVADVVSYLYVYAFVCVGKHVYSLTNFFSARLHCVTR